MSNRRKAKRPELVDPWVADELAADAWIEAWENEPGPPGEVVELGYITTDGLTPDSPPPMQRMIEKPEDYRFPRSWSFADAPDDYRPRRALTPDESETA